MSSTAGLARPAIDLAQVHQVLRDYFQLDGDVRELGSQQDRNFCVASPDGSRRLLKISNPVFSREEVDAQNAAMTRLAEAGFATPVPIGSAHGDLVTSIDIDGRPHDVRLLTWVSGIPLAQCGALSAETLSTVGDLVGRVSLTLAEFHHPGLDRALQWDLRRAVDVVADLVSFVGDPQRRYQLQSATAEAATRLAALSAELPIQAIHGDLTDDNIVWVSGLATHIQQLGVIDFGDTHRSWRVAELAVACSFVLHVHPEHPMAILPLVRAFNDVVRLTEPEVDALWPLIVLRGASLAVSGAEQISIDPGNDYARERIEAEWQTFAVPSSYDTDDMTAAIRASLGRTKQRFGPLGALIHSAARTTVVDLSYASRGLESGAWLTDSVAAERAMVDAALTAGGMNVAVVPWGIPRLTRSGRPQLDEPESVPTFLEVHTNTAIELFAPMAGFLRVADGTFEIESDELLLIVRAIDANTTVVPAAGRGAVTAGTHVATVEGAMRIWLRPVSQTVVTPLPPEFVRSSEWPALQAIWFDPSAMLGVASTSIPVASTELTRRHRSYAPLQGHYYAQPPQIERGWREYLIDTTGRHYVDIVNNVAAVGHGHPRLVSAAADQWRMLNTNSRFHYSAIADLTERLLSTLPDTFDTVLLVNSGSEAVDLALRLSKAYTNRSDVLCVHESYHGWTTASDAVSTALSDNPLAEETRPEWVHVLDAPNAYRGLHRGPQAGVQYAMDAVAEIRRLAGAGHPLAAFIAEPRNGNAGAIAVPEGYLQAVYAEVRAGGGVAISDEVQVGYGRQGDTFWGYQQHEGVVPDIITVAKAMGNGHPLGAVITRAEIAEALARQGSFFSSAGGSTLSARIGVEVFDIIRDESLQRNALHRGEQFSAGFAALAETHPLIGTVHGRGLYQGVELVRDHDSLEPAVEETAWLCDRLLTLGVVVQPTGDRQNVLKVKPPMCISPASVDHVLHALDIALTELEYQGRGGGAR